MKRKTSDSRDTLIISVLFAKMKKQYGAILLAGGLSSRMGQDKASLEIEGQTLLERLLLILYPLSG